MINISTQSPAVWAAPPAQGPAAVSPVAAIRPLQEGDRNSQSGGGNGPEAQAARQERRRAEPGAAPILPRKSAETGRGEAASARSPAQAQRLAQIEGEQRVADEAAEQAAEEARREQLQSVLTNVWKASAAVVDRVLGRDEASSSGGAVGPEASRSVARPPGADRPTEQLSLPWPVQPQQRAVPSALNEGRMPVAYDERGNSSLAPLEPGALISRRV